MNQEQISESTNQIICRNLELRHSKLDDAKHFKWKKDLGVEATILRHKMNITTLLSKHIKKVTEAQLF